MRRGRKRIAGPVLAAAGADSAAAASAIAKVAAPVAVAGTPDNAASLAGKGGGLRPAGQRVPGRRTIGGGFYGWSIKHNIQEATERIGSPGQAARKSGQAGTT